MGCGQSSVDRNGAKTQVRKRLKEEDVNALKEDVRKAETVSTLEMTLDAMHGTVCSSSLIASNIETLRAISHALLEISRDQLSLLKDAIDQDRRDVIGCLMAMLISLDAAVCQASTSDSHWLSLQEDMRSVAIILSPLDLASAKQSGDSRRIKHALIIPTRLGVISEMPLALELIKQVASDMELPTYWDLQAMNFEEIDTFTFQEPGEVQEPLFSVGDRVMGLYRNKRWYDATIAEVTGNDYFLIDWHDGDTKDRMKHSHELQLLSQQGQAGGFEYSVGSYVRARYRNGKWYGATVAKVSPDDTYLLNWDDKDTADRVKVKEQLMPAVRPTLIEVGDRVLGLYPDKKWYSATVASIDKDTFLLNWDDQDTKHRTKVRAELRLVKKVQKVVNMLAVIPVRDHELSDMQSLLDASFRRVVTKDRKDSEVPQQLKVVAARQIQNAMNWFEYSQMQQKIRKDLDDLSRGAAADLNMRIEDLKTTGFFDDLRDEPSNSVILFHGTTPEAAEAIAREDFQISRSGSHRGTLFGKGIYLAESCTKADEYSKTGPDKLRCMLLCRVTLGNVLYCDDKSPDPTHLLESCADGSYHSVLGDREKVHGTFREFIVYNPHQVYPEYLLWYQQIYAA